MPDQDTRTIPLSWGKQVRVSIYSLCFVAANIWLLTLDTAWIAEHQWFDSPTLVYATGVLGLLMFGALAVFNIRKLFNRRPGVVLSEAGLLDQSTGVSVGFIPWSDITGVDTYKSFNRRTLVVRVSDPQKYLTGGNALARYLRKSTMKLCGSPVTITSAALKIRYDDLMAEIEAYLGRYGRTA